MFKNSFCCYQLIACKQSALYAYRSTAAIVAAQVHVDMRCKQVGVAPLQLTLSGGFDFLVAPLTHPRYRRRPTEALPPGQLRPPFARADVLLTTGQWSSQASMTG